MCPRSPTGLPSTGSSPCAMSRSFPWVSTTTQRRHLTPRPSVAVAVKRSSLISAQIQWLSSSGKSKLITQQCYKAKPNLLLPGNLGMPFLSGIYGSAGMLFLAWSQQDGSWRVACAIKLLSPASQGVEETGKGCMEGKGGSHSIIPLFRQGIGYGTVSFLYWLHLHSGEGRGDKKKQNQD